MKYFLLEQGTCLKRMSSSPIPPLSVDPSMTRDYIKEKINKTKLALKFCKI